jgi:hypothetical protein
MILSHNQPYYLIKKMNEVIRLVVEEIHCYWGCSVRKIRLKIRLFARYFYLFKKFYDVSHCYYQKTKIPLMYYIFFEHWTNGTNWKIIFPSFWLFCIQKTYFVIYQPNFLKRYCDCFNKPYFQPNFSYKKTSVAKDTTHTNLITLLKK